MRKLVSKGCNLREAMSINWSKCRREIEIGLDSSMEQIISAKPTVTVEEFLKWKRKILQEVDNKIISLKRRTKVHKANPVLKQNAIIEYLNELHKRYVLISIDKAANNIAIICKNYYVTVNLKEIRSLDTGNDTEKINKNQEEIIQDNLKYNARLNFSNRSKDKSLSIIYWIPNYIKLKTLKTVQLSLCLKQCLMYLNLFTPK